MKTKKILFTLAILLVSIGAFAVPTHVRVNPKAGDSIVIGFDEKPEITMLANGIRIASTSTASTSFDFDEIVDIDFLSTDKVQEAIESSIVMYPAADHIQFCNISEGTPFKVFSISGTLVDSRVVSGEYTLVKDSFPHGIYIVVVGSTTFKVSL